MHINRRLRKDQGQGLVEFAVIFPILAVIIFMIIDGGLLMGRYNNVNNTAKEAARYGAVGADATQIVARAKANAHGYLDSVLPADGNCADLGSSAVDDVICVQWINGPSGEAPGDAGSSVRVIIEHEYPFLTPIENFWGGGVGWTIKECAIQRLELRVSSTVTAGHTANVQSCDG